MVTVTIPTDGTDQTTLIRQKLQDSSITTLIFAPGEHHISRPTPTTSIIFEIFGRSNLLIEGTDAIIVYDWSRSTTNDQENSTTNVFRFVDCHNLRINGLVFNYSHRIFSQGVCMAVTATSFSVQVDPNFEPAWAKMDFFGSYDRTTGQFQETQYDLDDERDSVLSRVQTQSAG